MTKPRLIEILKAELERQSQQAKPGVIYLYNQSENEIGVDGTLDLGELADALLPTYNEMTQEEWNKLTFPERVARGLTMILRADGTTYPCQAIPGDRKIIGGKS